MIGICSVIRRFAGSFHSARRSPPKTLRGARSAFMI
jgi:hypothetical protein